VSKVLTKGNYILANVNGTKKVLTSTKMQQLINEGYDVEVATAT
jgi:hypothetical protein